MLRIFTDGSCTHNGRKGARASYGVIYPDKLIESWGAPITNGTQTNQTAELTAIYEGIKKGTTLSGNPAHVDVHVFSAAPPRVAQRGTAALLSLSCLALALLKTHDPGIR